MVRFYSGFAVCPRFHLEAAGNANDILPLMLSSELRASFATNRGLRFFIPDCDPPCTIVDFRELKRLETVQARKDRPNGPDHDYVHWPEDVDGRLLRRLHSVANVNLNPADNQALPE